MAVTVEVGSADFLWTPNNCPANVGNVTDKLCCGADTFCRKLVTEVACNSDTDDAALYCEWEDGQCQPVADRESNVCCRDQEINSCAKIFKGECPEQFEVERGCCQGDAAFTKFAFLKTSDPDHLVCCNAPCAAMEAANCTLTPQCAPSQRSFAVHHPFGHLGFHGYGHGGHHFGHKFGTIFHGTGFGYDYPPYGGPHYHGSKGKRGKKHRGKGKKGDYKDDEYHYEDKHDHHHYHKDYDHSKYDHVDEITVDDIFALMIDAMEKETDVKIYDADITSDPYLGKNWSGGLFVDHHLPNTDHIFNELYAHPNHYGHYPYDPYFGGGYGGGYGGHYPGFGHYGSHQQSHYGSHQAQH